MNLSTMRFLDRRVGVPLCFGLTLCRRGGDLLRFGRRRRRPVRRVLFVKLAEQGSTVLAVSALRKAIEMVGRENVYFLAFEENRFILDIMRLIPEENVIPLATDGPVQTLLRSLSVVRKLRGLRLDAAVDMEFFARSSAVFTYLSGASTRVGFHRQGEEGPYRGKLMTHALRFSPHMHTSQVFRFMVDAIELDPGGLPTIPFTPVQHEDDPPEFTPNPEELERVRRLIASEAGTDAFRPLVLLNANCSDMIPLRAWPAEHYVELAQRLLDSSSELGVAFTGGPEEAPAAEALVRQIDSRRCFCLAGRTTLRDLLVVFHHADVLVTNDSGPAHFASLTPIEVITLFGPEHPAIFGSRSPRNQIVWAGLACSPCVSALNNRESACRNNLCMKQIEPELIRALVLERLGLDRSDGSAPIARVRPQVVELVTRAPRSIAGGVARQD